MATMLKKLPAHFDNLQSAQNAIAFAFALEDEGIRVEVSSVAENGQVWMLMQCINGKESAFRRLCEQYHPESIVDSSEVR